MSRARVAPAVELALDARALLGEGPVWDGPRGELVWVDIDRGLVHRYAPASGEDRPLSVGQEVGAAVPRLDGGLVLALRDGFGMLEPGARAPELVMPIEPGRQRKRMNDGACDTRGRFWAGTMSLDRARATGSLYRLDPDLRATRVLSRVSISNGLGWSPDDRLMYFIDTPTGTIDVFDFEMDSGQIRARRPLVVIPASEGRPDGMTVDTEGCLWVALWGRGAVQRYAPDGTLDRRVELPASQITSCCFGDGDCSTLYITSARRGLRHPERLAGAIFACRPGVQGLPASDFAGP